MKNTSLLDNVVRYYTEKVQSHGPTARGVDWNGERSQCLRFEQLLRSECGEWPRSINDYGCGYGALALYLEGKKYRGEYRGFDISSDMIYHAHRQTSHVKNCSFTTRQEELNPAELTVASGVFNVKQDIAVRDWEEYVGDTLSAMAKVSKRALAFNMLTSYCDADKMRPHLYYGDPHHWFRYCREGLSPRVALLHDYPLYEFTMVVHLE